MRLECPTCSANLHITTRPDNGIARCPKCKKPFRLPEEEPEVEEPEVEEEDSAEEDDRPKKGGKKGEKAEKGDKKGKKKKGKKAEKKSMAVPLAIGGGLVAFGIVAVVIAVVATGGSKKDGGSGAAAAANDVAPAINPKRPGGSSDVILPPGAPGGPPAGGPAAGPGPGGVTAPAGGQLPAEYAALFKESVDRPAPTVQVPTLKASGGGKFLLPAFAELGGGRPAPGNAGKLTPAEIKKAAVFIKVEGGGQAGSGSGFVVRVDKTTGYVATNHHVIKAAIQSPTLVSAGKVTVVFDSGLPTEVRAPGEVVAINPIADLAVVKVTGVADLPKPIDPKYAVKPVERLPIQFWGYPLGELLATGGRNPAVTASDATVSSLRLDEEGRLNRVQINGTLNPGNSGGPVLDPDGRLVGIAVSTIKTEFATGIGFAVPAHELVALLDGRVLYPAFTPIEVDNGEAVFQVMAPVLDPYKQLKEIALNVKVLDGGTPPAPKPSPKTGWEVVPGATKSALTPGVKGFVQGELRLPSKEGGSLAVVQITCRNEDGDTIASRPTVYKLGVDAAATASDAMALTAFARNLSRYEGQVVVVRGKLVPPANPKWNIFELQIRGENDSAVPGVTFLTTREIVLGLDDLPPDQNSYPVRLTLRVGAKGPDGKTPARVTRVDLIGRGDRLVRSIPAPEGAGGDSFAALARNPDKYAGRKVEFDALLVPRVFGTSQEPELLLLMPNETVARNLYFATSPSIATQLNDAGLGGDLNDVRVTVRVENKKRGAARCVTVLKVELLDSDGQVRKTIE